MCTMTYMLTEAGYEVFFSRDEQHSRPVALPPEYRAKHKAIYPVDPEGLGTWLAVNHKGKH